MASEISTKSADPASLINLHDIALPADISWWPLADGWYVLAALAVFLIVWFSYKLTRKWLSNRYRRAALKELQLLSAELEGVEPEKGPKRDSSLRQIPMLIKRTALSFYPRSMVAALTGDEWGQFLSSTTKAPAFTHTASKTMSKIAYSSGSLHDISSSELADLLNSCNLWISNHQAIDTVKTC